MAEATRRRRLHWLRWIIWPLVILAIGVTIAWHVFLSPKRLRAMAQSHLSEMIEGNVRVADAQFALGSGIVVKGISVEDRNSVSGIPVAQIESVTLRPRWGPLLSGNVILKSVRIERPRISLELDESGQWLFLSRIHVPATSGGPLPRVEISGGDVQVTSIGLKKRVPDLKFSAIEASIHQWGTDPSAWWADIRTREAALGPIHVVLHRSELSDQVQGNVSLSGVALGPRIRAMLPPSISPTWDKFQPGGVVAVQSKVVWDSTKEPPLKIEGHAMLENASMRIPGLPDSVAMSLTNITGQVNFDPKGARTEGISAKLGDAPFVINSGSISFEKDGPFKLAGSAYGCKVQGVFKDIVPAETRKQIPAWLLDYLNDATVQGKLDGAFAVSRAKAGADVQTTVDATTRDLTVSHIRLGYPLILNASMRYANGAWEFSQASAKWGRARIDMLGKTTFSLSKGAGIDLAVRVSNLELDRQFHDLLPAVIAQRFDESPATGTLDVDFHLNRALGADTQTHTQVIVYIRDGTCAYVDFPYKVQHLFGRVDIEDGILKGAEVSGMNGTTQIGVTLKIGPVKRYCIIRAMGGVLTQDVRNAMPPTCLKLWDAMKPEGNLDLNLVIEYWDAAPGVEKSLFKFDATLPKLTVQAGMPVQITLGHISVEQLPEEKDGQLILKGRFHMAEARFDRVQVEALRGTFQSRDGVLKLEDVSADCYGGILSGKLAILGGADEANVTADKFEGELLLKEASVASIVEGTDIKDISGRLYASSLFSGSVDNPQDFRAHGAMAIRDGRIGKLRGILGNILGGILGILDSPLNVVRLHKLEAAPFHDMEFNYEVKGSVLIAHEINLIGDSIRLHGKGIMDKDGKSMHFKFEPDLGPNLPEIPGVHQLFSAIRRTLFSITVTGDPNDPVWQMNPALSLTRSIQSSVGKMIPLNFLNPRKESGTSKVPAK